MLIFLRTARKISPEAITTITMIATIDMFLLKPFPASTGEIGVGEGCIRAVGIGEGWVRSADVGEDCTGVIEVGESCTTKMAVWVGTGVSVASGAVSVAALEALRPRLTLVPLLHVPV